MSYIIVDVRKQRPGKGNIYIYSSFIQIRKYFWKVSLVYFCSQIIQIDFVFFHRPHILLPNYFKIFTIKPTSLKSREFVSNSPPSVSQEPKLYYTYSFTYSYGFYQSRNACISSSIIENHCNFIEKLMTSTNNDDSSKKFFFALSLFTRQYLRVIVDFELATMLRFFCKIFLQLRVIVGTRIFFCYLYLANLKTVKILYHQVLKKQKNLIDEIMVQGGDPLQCAWTKNENCKIKKNKRSDVQKIVCLSCENDLFS